MGENGTFTVTLERLAGYEFQALFEGTALAPLLLDESPPLGGGRGPNPSRLLAAAVGNCLSASLLFCLEKARVPVQSVRTCVRGTTRRNERGRLRVAQLDVEITLDLGTEDPQRAARCLDLFEDFCVVTASVRQGIPVNVRVVDPRGNVLRDAAPAA